MVLLFTLGIKLYKSEPTLNIFDRECGKLKFPILPKDVATGAFVKSPLKLSFIRSLVFSLVTKATASPQKNGRS